MNRYLACAAAAALALVGASAQAYSGPGLTVTSANALPLYSAGFTLGWEFQTSDNITIDGLGVYDATGLGLTSAHDVGLWDASGNLLASATVAAGTADPSVAGFRYVSTAPVALSQGQYYIGASYQDVSDALIFPGVSGSSFTTAAPVAYLQSTYEVGSSLVDPTNGNGSPGYFGPNFTMVPEPSQWALMMVGVFGLGAVLRGARRKLAKAAAAV